MADDSEMIRLLRQIRVCAVIVAGASLLWVMFTLFPELPVLLNENRTIVLCGVGLIAVPLFAAWLITVFFPVQR